MAEKFHLACTVIFVGASLASVRADDYVRLTADDTGDNSSFIQLSRWSDKQLPHPDADYIVTNNFLLRAPKAGNEGSSTNHVFGGRSLTIGTLTSAGRLGVRTRNTEKTTVDNLIFVKGQLRQIVNNNDTRLHGAITVQSPSNTPFCIQSSADGSLPYNASMRWQNSVTRATLDLFDSRGICAPNYGFLPWYHANALVRPRADSPFTPAQYCATFALSTTKLKQVM